MDAERLVFPKTWRLRKYQEPAWDAWRSGKRRALLVWHRRAGKDEYALNKTAIAAQERIGNYWHCLPQYEQARKAIWEAINPNTGRRRIDEAFPPEIRKRTDNTGMVIEFNPPRGYETGSIWRVVGSDNPDSLVGAPPIGIVFSEWALSNPDAWAYLAPILAENGGWADFITTPRGRNHVYNMLKFRNNPNWFVEILDVTKTGFPMHLVEEERQNYHTMFGVDAGDAKIEQEYYCSFEAAILGAYWGRELSQAEKDGRITKVPVAPGIPIHTSWDLGKGANMSVWVFQRTQTQLRIIEHIKGHGIGIPSMVKELNAKGYKGGDDWVPHDARVPELGTEKTRVEILAELKRRPRVVPNHHKADGVEAVRKILPYCYFDAERCQYGLEALRQYRADWDEDRKMFGDKEVHDWTSHPADAFRYLAMAESPPPPPPQRAADGLAKLKRKKTLDEMLEEYDHEMADD